MSVKELSKSMEKDKDPLKWIDLIALIALIIGIIFFFNDRYIGVSIAALPVAWLGFRYFGVFTP